MRSIVVSSIDAYLLDQDRIIPGQMEVERNGVRPSCNRDIAAIKNKAIGRSTGTIVNRPGVIGAYFEPTGRPGADRPAPRLAGGVIRHRNVGAPAVEIADQAP